MESGKKPYETPEVILEIPLEVKAGSPMVGYIGPVVEDNLLTKIGEREIEKGVQDVKRSGLGDSATYTSPKKESEAWDRFEKGHERMERGEKIRNIGKQAGKLLDD